MNYYILLLSIIVSPNRFIRKHNNKLYTRFIIYNYDFKQLMNYDGGRENLLNVHSKVN